MTYKHKDVKILAGGTTMKNKLIVLIIVVTLLLTSISTAFAGGDKVRGENGQGEVNQVQVQDPPPFQ